MALLLSLCFDFSHVYSAGSGQLPCEAVEELLCCNFVDTVSITCLFAVTRKYNDLDWSKWVKGSWFHLRRHTFSHLADVLRICAVIH